jgi:hypothetical protein
MSNLNMYVKDCIDKLRGPNRDNVYHALIFAPSPPKQENAPFLARSCPHYIIPHNNRG